MQNHAVLEMLLAEKQSRCKPVYPITRILNLLGVSYGPSACALVVLFFIGLFFAVLLTVIAAILSTTGVLEDNTFVLLIAIRILPGAFSGAYAYLLCLPANDVWESEDDRRSFLGLRNILTFFEFGFCIVSVLLFVHFFRHSSTSLLRTTVLYTFVVIQEQVKHRRTGLISLFF